MTVVLKPQDDFSTLMLEAPSTAALARLFLLRLFCNFEPLTRVVRSEGLNRQEIAIFLGLEEWLHKDVKKDQGEALMATLRSKLTQAEAKPTPFPEPLYSNLRALCNLLELDEVSVPVLVAVALYRTVPALEEASVLADNNYRSSRFVYNQLAAILKMPARPIKEVLDPNSSLIASGLVADRGFIKSAITEIGDLNFIAKELADRIVSEPVSPDIFLTYLLKESPKSSLTLNDFPHLNTEAEVLSLYLKQAQSRQTVGVNILLYGPPGTGKTEFARCISESAELALYELDFAVDREKEIYCFHRLRLYRSAQALLPPGENIFLVDDAEDVFSKWITRDDKAAGKDKHTLNSMLESNPIPTIWVTNKIQEIDPAYVRRFDTVIELGVPPFAQRQRIARQYAGDLISDDSLERLAKLDCVAPGVISRAAGIVAQAGKDRTEEERSGWIIQLVENTLKAQGHKGVKHRLKPTLQGAFDPAIIHTSLDPTTLLMGLEEHGVARMCFYGPPGTGKTALGVWLAQELKKPLMSKKVSDLVSPFVGQTEHNFGEAFHTAEQDGAVLMLDEVDSFLSSRDGASNSWEVAAINEMLTQMEQFQGIFIASTNRFDSLDEAALRRFDLKLLFKYLSTSQAESLFRRYCLELGISEGEIKASERVKELHQVTPGDFAAIARQSRFHPIVSPLDFLERLLAECSLKTGNKGRIGF